MKPLFTVLVFTLISGAPSPVLGQELREKIPRVSARSEANAKRIQERRERDGVEEDDALARSEWMHQRMGGALPREFWLRLVNESRKVREARPEHFLPAESLNALAALAPSSLIWTNLGPTAATKIQNGPVTLAKVDSGRLRAILPHPSDPNTVYVAAAHGGLWKTSNFLAATPTWTPLTDFLGSTSVGAVAFGHTPQTIYLGMGDPFGTGAGYGNATMGNYAPGLGGEGNGGFVFQSLDGGTTWSAPVLLASITIPLNQAPTPTITWDLKVDTSAPQDIVLVATNIGIQRSVDGGATFTVVLPSVLVYSLVQTSLGWLASTQSFTPDPNNTKLLFHVNPNPGVLYLSQDHGATWTPVPNPGAVLTDLGRTTLAVGAPGDAVVYAFAQSISTRNQRDLYRSADGGNSWTAVGLPSKAPTNPNGDQSDMNLMGTQAIYNQLLAVDPSDASRNTVYLGGQLSSARTTNGGTTWTLVSNWLPGAAAGTASLPYVHADMHAAAFSGNSLLFGTDGGIFVTSDAGQTWDDRKNVGLVTHEVHSMSCFGDGILLGLQDNGTRVREGATSVFNMPLGGDGFGTGWSPVNAVTLGTHAYGVVSRSTIAPPMDASNWSSATSGLTEAGNPAKAYFFTPIATAPASADPQGLTFMTYTQGKAFVTTNGGASWTLQYDVNGLSQGIKAPPRAVMHGAAFSPIDTQHMAVAGGGGTLLWTEFGLNGTWTGRYLYNPANPSALDWVTGLSTVAYVDNIHLYVGSESPIPNTVHVVKVTASSGVLTNVPANGNLPDTPVTKLVVDRRDATGNTVLAATWIGLFRTTDGGTTWAPYGTGLPQMPITDIYLSPDGTILRASTFGRGVWEATTAVAPTFTQQPTPATLTVTVGQTAAFTATAAGNPAPTYQWRKNGSPISGATSGNFILNAVVLADAGTYDVVATNPAGSATSNPALLTVNPAVAISAIAPVNPTVFTSTVTTFAATVTNTADTAIVWSATGGSMNVSTGAWTAPATSGSVTITATSHADPTKTSTTTATVVTADLNGDGVSDILDLAILARAYGSTPTSPNWNPAADLNGDGVVNDPDLTLFFSNAGF